MEYQPLIDIALAHLQVVMGVEGSAHLCESCTANTIIVNIKCNCFLYCVLMHVRGVVVACWREE